MTPVPPPPRAIVPTHPAPILKFIARLLLLAIFAATLVLWLALLHELLFKMAGRRLDARVMSIREVRTSSGARKYTADVTYTLPGQALRSDTLRINWTSYRRMSMPAILASQPNDHIVFPPDKSPTLAIGAYALGPVSYARANEHEWGFVFMLIPAIFAPLGLLLSFALYLAIILRPRWRRALYIHGQAVAGTITGKSSRSVKHGHLYYVHYTFAPADGSAPLSDTAMLPGPGEYQTLAAGAPITVLHDPRKPRHNVPYEWGGYRWA